MQREIDQQQVQEFAGKIMGLFTGGLLSFMVDIGYKTGLFEAAAQGPGTSQRIAERANLNERYVREWLGAMATSGIFNYDAASLNYSLPTEHAMCLAGDSGRNLSPLSQMIAHMGKHVHQIADAFRNGGGVPYSEFRPEFTGVMDAAGRRRYGELLISGYLPAAKGIQDRLRQGIQVADVGCGTGYCINLMAQEFPNSTFVGYDIAEDAIALGNAEAREMGLHNARFEVMDATQLPQEPKLDLITAFDSIHDQVDPATVLRRVSEALAPDGAFMMIDIKASSNLEDNFENPLAPYMFGVSVMHCMTTSLAHGGTGLGTMWGEQVARSMLSEAGFGGIEIVDGPAADLVNSIYVCHK